MRRRPDLTRCLVCRQPVYAVCRRHTRVWRCKDGQYRPAPLPLCQHHYSRHDRLVHKPERDKPAVPDPPRVAHCGRWFEILEVPFVTPCCGMVLFF
jgi:hypothetical protein